MIPGREPGPNAEVLPDAVASRLLTRASELDAMHADSLNVADLRAAASEAGISEAAFEAALGELRRTGSAPLSDVRSRRRAGPRFAAALIVGATLVAVSMFAFPRPHAANDVSVPPVVVDPPTVPTDVRAPAQAIIRTAEGAASTTMQVGQDGQLFGALGVAPDVDGRRVGRVHLAGSGGWATTPAALEVSSDAGEVTFRAPRVGSALEVTVPGTSLRARGHAIRLVRELSGGPLRVEVVGPAAK